MSPTSETVNFVKTLRTIRAELLGNPKNDVSAIRDQFLILKTFDDTFLPFIFLTDLTWNNNSYYDQNEFVNCP